jgi:mannose-6-phosphate isomerase-like protein (cupin superfamily)
MQKSVLPRQLAESLTELWSPRVIGAIDDLYVKVAKLQGTFCWHNHPHEDELFFVLKGSLRIDLDGGVPVVLNEGEMFVVPKGIRHCPVAEEECLVMLIERTSTLHSGNVVNERTRSLAEQLRPFGASE